MFFIFLYFIRSIQNMKKTPLYKRFVLMTNRTTAHGARDQNQFMYNRSYQLSTPANMDMFTTATVSLGSTFTKFKQIILRTLTKKASSVLNLEVKKQDTNLISFSCALSGRFLVKYCMFVHCCHMKKDHSDLFRSFKIRKKTEKQFLNSVLS
jgi:hypothetical protein